MSLAPDIWSGSLAGPTTFVPSGKASQIAIHNRDTAGSFTMTINDSNQWTLDSGEKLGLNFPNSILKVTLSPVLGTPLYQLLIK